MATAWYNSKNIYIYISFEFLVHPALIGQINWKNLLKKEKLTSKCWSIKTAKNQPLEANPARILMLRAVQMSHSNTIHS